MLKKTFIVSTSIGILNFIIAMNVNDQYGIYTSIFSTIFYSTIIINIICLVMFWNNKDKKNCPYCTKLINKKAIKCPYCQSNIK